MSDFEAPTPVLPPPLPPTMPQPVLPAGPAGGYPAYQDPTGSPYAGASGPYYRPPEFFEVAAPPSGGGSDWILWGVGGVIVLMIGLGAGFLVAVRGGPSRAAAAKTPAPAWAPAATPPRVIVPSPTPIRITLAPVPSQVAPAVKLPTERELDLQLKQMWQKGETGGLSFRTIKTLKSVRQSGTSVQPVAASIKGSFPKAVLFLQSMRDSMPSTALESFQIAPDAADPASLQADMTFGFYFQPEAADASIASGPPPAADVARGLAELANRAAIKYQFVSISVKAERAADAGVAAPPPAVTLVARTESDVEVAAYIRSLNQSARFSDVNLVVSDTEQYAGRTYRKFTIELKLAPKPRYGSPVGVSGMPLQAGEVFDAFQPATAFRQMPPSAPPGFAPPAMPSVPRAVPQPRRPVAPPRSPEQDKADLTRAVQQLSLESITTNGRTRACVLNGRLYRVGDLVNGVNVDAIGDDAVIVRKGDQKFELKLPKP